jgi:hypothetical protein
MFRQAWIEVMYNDLYLQYSSNTGFPSLGKHITLEWLHNLYATVICPILYAFSHARFSARCYIMAKLVDDSVLHQRSEALRVALTLRVTQKP